MIHLSLLFWAALALPGFVALGHLDRDAWKSGLLGTLGLSYLVTLALLTPISILGYVLHLPVSVFSGFCVLLILAGAAELIRQRWWVDAWQILKGAAGIELLILLAVLVISARVGAIPADPAQRLGDAAVHLTRVRQLLDHGLTNEHPFVAGGYFFSMYHTNLLHALLATCAWVTRIDYLGVWSASLPFAELLVAAGSAYLAWCVFERRWATWVAGLFILATRAPVTFLIYPNQLAPFWLLPILIGLGIRAAQSPCRWRRALLLGAGVLVISQVHGLYGLFALLLLAPLLGSLALVKLVRRRADRWPQAACVMVLALAIPSPLITKLTSRAPESGAAPVTAAPKVGTGFTSLEGGWVVKEPLAGFGDRHGFRFWLLIAGIGVGLLSSRRGPVGCAAVVVLTAAAAFFIPPLCTALVRVAGSSWILARLDAVFFVAFAALVPAAAAFLLDTRVRWWWVRAILSVGAFAVALPYAGPLMPNRCADFWNAAWQPARARHAKLDDLRAMRGFFSRYIPPGETILVDDSLGTLLVMLCDCHVVSPAVATLGVPRLAERQRDNARLLADGLDWAERRALLRQCKIRYYVPVGPAEWRRDHSRNVWTLDQPRVRVVELDVE